MGNNTETKSRSSSISDNISEHSSEDENTETVIKSPTKQPKNIIQTGLTIILANEEKLCFSKEEIIKRWDNYIFHFHRKDLICSLQFINLDQFKIFEKMWEINTTAENESVFEEKDDEILILYIIATYRIGIEINIDSNYAMNILLKRNKLHKLKEKLVDMKIYDDPCAEKFNEYTIFAFHAEIQKDGQNKWIRWDMDSSLQFTSCKLYNLYS